MPPPSLRGPKIIVGLTSLVTVSAIVYSHYSQVTEKQTMRAGVERDKERMRLKKKLRKQEEAERAKE